MIEIFELIMDAFIIVVDNKNFNEILIYFQKLLFNNDYVWNNGSRNIERYYEPTLLLGINSKCLLQSRLSNYNEDYSQLYRDYDLKHIYDANNIKDILTFIKRYSIKDFKFNEYIKLIENDNIKINIVDALYSKKKKVNESIKIKKFNKF